MLPRRLPSPGAVLVAAAQPLPLQLRLHIHIAEHQGHCLAHGGCRRGEHRILVSLLVGQAQADAQHRANLLLCAWPQRRLQHGQRRLQRLELHVFVCVLVHLCQHGDDGVARLGRQRMVGNQVLGDCQRPALEPITLGLQAQLQGLEHLLQGWQGRAGQARGADGGWVLAAGGGRWRGMGVQRAARPLPGLLSAPSHLIVRLHLIQGIGEVGKPSKLEDQPFRGVLDRRLVRCAGEEARQALLAACLLRQLSELSLQAAHRREGLRRGHAARWAALTRAPIKSQGCRGGNRAPLPAASEKGGGRGRQAISSLKLAENRLPARCEDHTGPPQW